MAAALRPLLRCALIFIAAHAIASERYPFMPQIAPIGERIAKYGDGRANFDRAHQILLLERLLQEVDRGSLDRRTDEGMSPCPVMNTMGG